MASLLLAFLFLRSFEVFYGYAYRIEIVGVVVGLVSFEAGVVQGLVHVMAGHPSVQMEIRIW